MDRAWWIAAGLAVAVGASAQAQPRPPAVNEALQRQWGDRFLQAYAEGTPQAFETFCELYDVPTGVDPVEAKRFCAGYLYRFRLRYGPVSLKMVEARETGPRYWLEGDLSHAVWGVSFIPTAGPNPRIDGASVSQGVYPKNYPEPPRVGWSQAPAWLDSHFTGLARAGVFSGQVLVARGDEILFQRAYGVADQAAGTPITTDTRMRIASVGKMMTAMAILDMADKGQLDLDAPVARYYPAYPSKIASQITARHLLTHTSGLEIDDYEPFVQAVNTASGLDDILAAQIRYVEHMNEGRYPNFKPLGTYDYSNEDLDLLGGLLQQIDGRPWDEVVRARVLRPAGANGVVFVRPDDRVARGYSTQTPQGWTYVLADTTADLRPVARPAGSQYATATDLFRLLRHIEARREKSPLVEAATRRQVLVDDAFGPTLGYGFGFETEEHACFRSYGHAGVEAGVNGVARHYPDQDLTIIILANRDGVAIDAATYLERTLLSCG